MKPETEIRLTWIVICVICSFVSIILYFVDPILSIIPPALAFGLLLTNMYTFNLSFKELVFGVEQQSSREVKHE